MMHRIRVTTNAMSMFPHRARFLLCATIILIVNAWICTSLFKVEFTANLHSNEGSFISLSRFLLQHDLGATWFNRWDGGMSMQNTYAPLLPYLTARFSAATHDSPARSFHVVCALFYCAGPLALFLLVHALTRRLAVSLWAGALYSLASPVLVLVPLLRHDAGGFLMPRRLQNLLFYGEAPHVASLTLLALTGFLFYAAVTRSRTLLYVFGVLCAAATILTNAFGAISLLVFLSSLALASDQPVRFRRLGAAWLLVALAYLLVCPLLPPSVLNVIRHNAPIVGGDFRFQTKAYLLAALAASLLILVVMLLPKANDVGVRFAVLFTAFYASVVLSAAYFDIAVLPQPYRYQLELDMGLCLLLSLALGRIRLPAPAPAAGLWLLVGIAAFVQASRDRQVADALSRPIAMTATSEYAVSQWIDQHLRGRRTMVSGDIAYWFNVFSDNPQFSGGHEPTTPNWMQHIAVFTIYTGMNAGTHDAEISRLWLEAFGCHAVVVPGPASQESYHPFANPDKFENQLPVLWRENGITIYGVPQRSPSVAHVMPASAIVHRRPINGLDVEPVRPYVRALMDPSLPIVQEEWSSPNQVAFTAGIDPNEVLSIQINHHPGWRAIVNGVSRPIQRDELGLMVIDPECSGPCRVVLSFERTSEDDVCLSLSALAALVLVALGFSQRLLVNRKLQSATEFPNQTVSRNRPL